jgi:serine/threonine-protein kinase
VITKRSPFASADGASAADPNGLVASLLGRRLEHFEIQEFVGGGGMGAVFRALDTRLDRPVALKVLSVGDANDESLHRRFQNEAQSAARLDHENIARVFYIGSDQGFDYISFEFIEGINIRDLVARDGPLRLAAAASYILQVAEALAHACSRDVVHRDIKPSNVLLTDGGHVKLVDMGLARLDDTRESREDLTASGVTLGTFDYISPEQARDPRNADVRSDIYSLGCTFYFMLTGRPPFPDGTVLQKLLQHQGDSPADPRQYNAGVPEQVCRVLAKMLAKNPDARYRHPQDLIADLLLLADELDLDLSAPANMIVVTTSTPRRSLLERHLPWAAPVVALLVIVAALELLSRLSPTALTSQDGGAVPAPQLGSVAAVDPTDAASAHSNSATATAVDSGPSPAAETSPPDFTDGPPAFPGNATEPDDDGNSPAGDAPPAGAAGNDGAGVASADNAASQNSVLPDGSQIRTDTAAEPPPQGISSAMRTAPNPSSISDDPSPTLANSESDEPANLKVGSAKLPGAIDLPPAEGSPSLPNGGVPPNLDDDPAAQGSELVENTNGAQRSPDDNNQPPPTEPTATTSNNNVDIDNVVSALRPDGLLIVGDDEDGDQHFRTLADACTAARSGDVIELRFSGRRVERPIELLGKDLTIRGGAGFQPQIAFRPNWSDSFSLSRGMLTVVRGRLTAIDVEFQLTLPRDATADAWAMFDVQAAKAIRLRRCVLTIRNANAKNGAWHEDVAFFVVAPDPTFDDMLDEPTTALPPVRIELEDTLARGEAVFVLTDDLFPFHLRWDNGLLVTSEHFLRAYGISHPTRGDTSFQIDLRHVTARVNKGFCQLGVDVDAAHMRSTQISCTDSIVIVDPSEPLIDQAGRDTITNLRRLVEWSGDHSFYEGFRVRWRLRGVDADDMPVSISLGTWTALANMREHSSLWGALVWQRPPSADQPIHQLSPDDYILDDQAADNPALTETTDGIRAGCDNSALPVPTELPPMETSQNRAQQR